MRYCSQCGAQMPDNGAFCVNCGASVAQQPAPAQGYPQPEPVQGYQQPAPAQGYPQAAPVQGYTQPVPAQVYPHYNVSQYQYLQGESKAKTALVCGILSIVTYGTILGGIILGIIAVINSNAARKLNHRSTGGRVTGIIGLCLSAIMLCVVPTIVISSYNENNAEIAQPSISATQTAQPSLSATPTDQPGVTATPTDQPAVPGTTPDQPSTSVTPSDRPVIPTPTTDTPQGFKLLENDTYGFAVIYPDTWLLTSDFSTLIDELTSGANMSRDEIIEALADYMGWDSRTAELLYNALAGNNQVVAEWYDTENVGTFTPNANLTITDSGGLTQEMLILSAVRDAILQASEPQFHMMFSNFRYVIEADGKILGDNYFMFYAFEGIMGGVELAMYQAITIIDENLYVFTFSTYINRLNESIPTFERMLSTLEPR